MAVFIGIMEAKSITWAGSVVDFRSVSNSELVSRNLQDSSTDSRSLERDTISFQCPIDIHSYTDLNSCESLISSGLDIADPNQELVQLSWVMYGATTDKSPSSGMNQINSYSFNEGTTHIEYSGVDRSGKTIFCAFVVVISDNQMPGIDHLSEDIIVAAVRGECGADVYWAEPTITDNCAGGGVISISQSHHSGEAFPIGTTKVEYSVEDGIEYNNVSKSFLVTVVDEEAPILVAPAALSLNCNDPIPAAFNSLQELVEGGGEVSDNCEIDAASFLLKEETRNGAECPYEIERTYIVADLYGNVTEATHAINVEDTNLKSGQLAEAVMAPPVITIDTTEIVTICEGDSITINTTASGDPVLTYLWRSIPAGFTSINDSIRVAPSADTTYIVEVTDGNGLTADDTITIVVDPLPLASVSGSATICSNGSATVSTASAANGTILWTHNGSGSLSNAGTLTPTYNAVAGDAGSTVVLTLTVTSNNACAPTTATATYNVQVDPLPLASVSGNETICSNGSATVSTASAANGTILWTHNGSGSLSNAGTLTPTYNAVAGDAGSTVVLTLTVTSTNACSPQVAQATFNVNVVNIPTVNSIANVAYCNGVSVSEIAVTGSATSFNWTNDNTSIGLAASGTGNIPAFTATNSGNSPLVANISITPVNTVGGVSCLGSAETFTITVNPDVQVAATPATQQICSGSAIANINITNPNSVAGVSYSWLRNNTSVLSGLESGTGNTISGTISSSTPGVLETTEFTITASANGCSAQTTVDVIVGDDTPPVPPTISSVVAQCDVTLTPPVATDNCDGAVTGTTSTVFPYSTTGVSMVSWTFTDAAGNDTTVNQVITIEDTQAPVWASQPAAIVSLECSADTSVTANGGAPTATDNCLMAGITYSDSIGTVGGCPSNYTFYRVWKAMDSSGNYATWQQLFSVSDNTAPIISCTDYTNFDPNLIPDYELNTGITATDNCSPESSILIELVSEEYFGLDNVAGFCPDSLQRVYRAMDLCGNVSETCTQTYIFQTGGSCSACIDDPSTTDDDVPFFGVIFDQPDSTWVSPNVVRNGICCFAEGPPPPRCISFNIYLHEDAVGLVFDIPTGAIPGGALYYHIDCGPPQQVGDVICLSGGRFYTLTFCEPGNNPNTYSIRSISGAVSTDDIVTRADEECIKNIDVTGLEPGTISWSVVHPAGADSLLSYLSCTDCDDPVFTPDSVVPSTIIYEVCGQLSGTYVCDGTPIVDCDQVMVTTLAPITINFDVDVLAICENAIPPINAEIAPTDLTYTYEWYDAADGGGNRLSTNPQWQPPGEGTYSLVITETESGVDCNVEITNFNIAYDVEGPSTLYVPDTLHLDCTDPNKELTIANWLALAYALDDDLSSIPDTNDYVSFTPVCGGDVVVRFWADDICGNRTIDSSVIHIVDNIAPVITAEATDQVVDCASTDKDTHPLYLAWLANQGGASASDDCDGNLVWSNNVATEVWVGNGERDSITVTFTATDDCGNTATTTAAFTIIDDQPPTITSCPANVENTIDAALCSVSGIVTENVVFEDLCSTPVLTWEMTGATTGTGSGQVTAESFNIGITQVTYTVTDAAGLTATCSFTVWVKHADFPTANVTCPADTVRADANAATCVASVTLAPPTYVDPCDEIDSVWNNSVYATSLADASGNYPIGITDFNWFIRDISGNTDSCAVTIVVSDVDPPQFTSCPDTLEDVIDAADCAHSGFVFTDPIYSEACGATLSFVLSGATTGSGTGSASGTAFNVGQTLVTYYLTDTGGNQDVCSFIVWVKHADFPTANITCPTDTVRADANAATCVASVTLAPPTYVDPCDEIDSVWNNSTYATSLADASGNYPIGITDFNWFIRDVSGNTDSCPVAVVISDVDPPQFTSCPDTLEDVIDAADCAHSGFVFTDPTYSEACGATLSYVLSGATTGSGTGSASGTAFNVGQTLVTYYLTDTGGNQDVCSFIVWVKHADFPTANITCPVDTVRADANVATCVASVTLAPPTYVDPCDEIDSVWNNSVYATSLADASGNYPIGITDFNWFIRDVSGNTDSCAVAVVVSDVDPPQFTSCPDTLEDVIDAADCAHSGFVFTDPTYSEACGATLSYVLSGATTGSGTGSASGTAFNVGQTLVKYYLTDLGGNQDSCSFIVWVKHANFPSLTHTCPQPSWVSDADAGECFATMTLDQLVVVSDPCDELDSIWHDSPFGTNSGDASGSYPVGTTNFSWYLRDVSGNVLTCAVSVQVNDLLPTLSCPANIVVDADYEEPFASGVVIPAPLFDDNCPDSTLTWVMTGATTGTGTGAPGTINLVPSPDTFNVGTTTIEYTFTDQHGNAVTCSFDVLVRAEPEIVCQPNDTLYADAGCVAAIDPGIPTLSEGVPPIDWYWEMTGVTTGSGSTLGANPLPNPIGVTSFNLGTTTIRWIAENVSGADTCYQSITVIDTTPPAFTVVTYEDCVDPLISAVYEPLLPNPNVGVMPNLIKVPSPDYHTFASGETALNLPTLSDNCCDSTALVVNWEITFSDTPDPLNPLGPYLTHAPVSGVGQPSEYGADIKLWGDGVFFTTVSHTIRYWVEDCNGNVSEPQVGTIEVTPRPEIVKQNY